MLFLLLTACKKGEAFLTDSIYGTYARYSGGQICSSGSGCWPDLSGVTIRVAPINSTYIKFTFPGYLGYDVVYDSVKLSTGRSFSFDQYRNGYRVYGSGSFGSRTISLEIRYDTSTRVHKYDNIQKLYDHY
jgi:hypothetical protein